MTVLGAVLAGGRGARIGGGKAKVVYEGRPLAVHAVEALRAVADEVVVVAKRGTPLPELDVDVWLDDTPEHHPRHGLLRALRDAGPEDAVLVLAVDLPRVTADVLEALLAAGAPAVAREGGRLQPLCGAYAAAALPVLEAAPSDEALTATVERLSPSVVDVPAGTLFNVNRPEDVTG